MRFSLWPTVLVALCAFGAWALVDQGRPASARAGAASPGQSLVVVASAEVPEAPTGAEVELAVEGRGATRMEAERAARQQLGRVREALERAGVAAGQVVPTGFAVAESGTGRGATAWAAVAASVRPGRRVGDVLAAAAQAGARSGGRIAWVVEPSPAAARGAAERALQAAQDIARQVAVDQGWRLGRPLAVQVELSPVGLRPVCRVMVRVVYRV